MTDRLRPGAALVLAAGEGTRMRSAVPKVLHPLCGRPLIAWPIGTGVASTFRSFGSCSKPGTRSFSHAVSVYAPIVSIAQPSNVATPATACFGFVVHARLALPAVVQREQHHER